MKTCFACAKELDEADRFCGHCGADQAVAPARPSFVAEPAAAPAQPDVAAYEPPAENVRRGRGLAILLVTVGLGAIGALAYTALYRDGESSAARFTLKDIGLPDIGLVSEPEAEEEPEPEPSDEPTEEPTPEATETPAPVSTPVAASSSALQPGTWRFTTQLVAISKVNPEEAFEISRQGIGSSESHSMCVSSANAESPRSIAFPFPPGLSCSPNSFTMADGAYRSTMTCSFPQFGGRRPVTASGRYSQVDLSVDVNVRVPAQVVSGDFERQPEIQMQYRIQGYLTGPC